jgi:hypothetical protein
VKRKDYSTISWLEVDGMLARAIDDLDALSGRLGHVASARYLDRVNTMLNSLHAIRQDVKCEHARRTGVAR